MPATFEADSRFLPISVYEYTPFCNGADEVKSPSDRLAAGLFLRDPTRGLQRRRSYPLTAVKVTPAYGPQETNNLHG